MSISIGPKPLSFENTTDTEAYIGFWRYPTPKMTKEEFSKWDYSKLNSNKAIEFSFDGGKTWHYYRSNAKGIDSTISSRYRRCKFTRIEKIIEKLIEKSKRQEDKDWLKDWLCKHPAEIDKIVIDTLTVPNKKVSSYRNEPNGWMFVIKPHEKVYVRAHRNTSSGGLVDDTGVSFYYNERFSGVGHNYKLMEDYFYVKSLKPETVIDGDIMSIFLNIVPLEIDGDIMSIFFNIVPLEGVDKDGNTRVISVPHGSMKPDFYRDWKEQWWHLLDQTGLVYAVTPMSSSNIEFTDIIERDGRDKNFFYLDGHGAIQINYSFQKLYWSRDRVEWHKCRRGDRFMVNNQPMYFWREQNDEGWASDYVREIFNADDKVSMSYTASNFMGLMNFMPNGWFSISQSPVTELKDDIDSGMYSLTFSGNINSLTTWDFESVDYNTIDRNGLAMRFAGCLAHLALDEEQASSISVTIRDYCLLSEGSTGQSTTHKGDLRRIECIRNNGKAWIASGIQLTYKMGFGARYRMVSGKYSTHWLLLHGWRKQVDKNQYQNNMNDMFGVMTLDYVTGGAGSTGYKFITSSNVKVDKDKTYVPSETTVTCDYRPDPERHKICITVRYQGSGFDDTYEREIDMTDMEDSKECWFMTTNDYFRHQVVELYQAWMYGEDGQIIQNLLPVRYNGKACMFDTITSSIIYPSMSKGASMECGRDLSIGLAEDDSIFDNVSLYKPWEG